MTFQSTVFFIRTAFAVLTLTFALQAQVGNSEKIVLDLDSGSGEAPVGFEARRSNVVDIGSGYVVTGEVAMITPLRRLPLGQSNLFFAFEPGTRRIVRVRGTAWVPSPYEGPYVEIRRPAQAEFGMDQGRNLALEVPLQDDRTYFFFKFDTGFEVAIGASGEDADAKPLTLTFPAGITSLFVVDPADPFIYLSGGVLLPVGKNEPKSDPQPSDLVTGGSRAGLGFSIQGLIPFRPATTYGVAGKVREFNGNQILSGSFPLGTLPVTATGYMVGAVDASDPLRISVGPLSKSGVNGIFDFGFPFLKVKKLGNVANFGFRLGNATAAMEVVKDVQYGYFSGVMAPDDSWIPDLVPLKPEAEAKAYAYVSSAGTDFQLHADGRYAVDAATLGKMAGIDLGEIFVVTGAVHVDATEFRLAGTTEDSLGALGYEQSRRLELVIPFNHPEGRYLRIEGMNRFVTLRLEGRALIAHQLASISGRLDSPAVDIQVEGVIETPPGGPSIASGTMSVGNPIRLAIGDVIMAEAQRHRESFGNLYDDYRAASKDYEVELSLRGMRTAIPAVCDAILRMLDAGEDTAHARLNSKWPKVLGVRLPGLSDAKRRASSEINAHRSRIRTLKSTVQQGDDAVRAALRNAVNTVLANRVVRISIHPVGTVYSQEIINDSNAGRLRTVLAAIDALPAVSTRKARAEAAWNAAPKREDLLATADHIVQQGIAAIPQIKSIGFRQPVFQAKLTLYVVLVHLGKESVYQVEFDAANPLSLGKVLGDAFAVTLR